jgi:hypothetical protein
MLEVYISTLTNFLAKDIEPLVTLLDGAFTRPTATFSTNSRGRFFVV